MCPCKCGSTGLPRFVCVRARVCVRAVCVCVAAPSQPSAPPAGKGPGLRHQLQAGMRMAESQTLPWVIMFESDQTLLGAPKILLLQL